MSETESKCENHELCNHNIDPYSGSPFCITCGSWFSAGGFGWDKLTFIDCDEECPVCYEQCNRKLMFPTNCGHSFCIKCSKDILFYDESRYHLSQVPYGCPPCPNGCENPIREQQCQCEEYSAIQNIWEQNDPELYKLWYDNEDDSINEPTEEVYGRAICPLCRSKYERD